MLWNGPLTLSFTEEMWTLEGVSIAENANAKGLMNAWLGQSHCLPYVLQNGQTTPAPSRTPTARWNPSLGAPRSLLPPPPTIPPSCTSPAPTLTAPPPPRPITPSLSTTIITIIIIMDDTAHIPRDHSQQASQAARCRRRIRRLTAFSTCCRRLVIPTWWTNCPSLNATFCPVNTARGPCKSYSGRVGCGRVRAFSR